MKYDTASIYENLFITSIFVLQFMMLIKRSHQQVFDDTKLGTPSLRPRPEVVQNIIIIIIII